MLFRFLRPTPSYFKPELDSSTKTMATGGIIPDRMKCVQHTEYGDARQVLSVVNDAEVPRILKLNQVLVKIHAVSINSFDWKILNGNVSLIQKVSFPHIPGMDCSGVIVDVGSDVERFKIGDSVYGTLGVKGGAFAEYARDDEAIFALKPANLNYAAAAAIPTACVTSYKALFERLKCTKGTKILICGGPSATGLYAIQLAKSVGALVATTASTRNTELIKKLGYRVIENPTELNDSNLLVIDYTKQGFGSVLQDQQFDCVYDCAGGQEQWQHAQQIMKQGGHFLTIAGDDPESETNVKSLVHMAGSMINRKFSSLFGPNKHSYSFHRSRESVEALDDLRVNYIETGKVKPILDTVYNDWSHFIDMFEKSKSGKAQGKLVLKIVKD